MNTRILSLILIGALFSSSALFGLQPPSARNLALKHGYYSFSDDAAGLLYNPAMMGYAPTTLYSVSHSPRFLGTSLESATGLWKFQKNSASVILNLSHHLLPYEAQPDVNLIYQDGFSQSGNEDQNFDFETAVGFSFTPLKNLFIGASYEVNYQQLYQFNHFNTFFRMGAAYQWHLPYLKEEYVRVGYSLGFATVGNSQTEKVEWEEGFNTAFAARYISGIAKTELGMDIVIEPNPFQNFSSDVQNYYYGEDGSYFGIGIEALKYWYFSPKLSLKFPFTQESMGLNVGFSTGIDFNGYYYELAYGLESILNDAVAYENVFHSFTFSIRRSLGQFTSIAQQPFYFYEGLKLFNTLKESFPTKERVPLKRLKNGISMNAKKIDQLSEDRSIANLQKDSQILLDTYFVANPSIQKKDNAEIILQPKVSVSGKILRLEMTALNRSGNIIYQKKFDGDYVKGGKEFEDIDTLHLKMGRNGLVVLPAQTDNSERRNRKNLEEIFAKWEADFFKFITKRYIKKVTIPMNQLDSLLLVNNTPVAYYDGTPIELFLKPGQYTFKARSEGRNDLVISKSVNKNDTIPLFFKEGDFNIDLKLALLGKKQNLSAELDGDKYKFDQFIHLSNIHNSANEISLKGLGKKLKIPLSFSERKIYTINLLNNFSTSFRERDESLWQPAVFSPKFDVNFSRRGLTIKGTSDNNQWRGYGVTSKPILMNEMEIKFDVEKRKRGDFCFVLLGEQNRRTAVLFKGRTLSVESNHRKRRGSVRALVKALRVYRKSLSITMVYKRGILQVYEGSTLIYENEFVPTRSTQIAFLADAEKSGEAIDFVVKNFSYKML